MDEKEKTDHQAKVLLIYIVTAGCLLFACGVGIIFGWGWSLVVTGLILLLLSALCIVGYALGDG